LPTVLPDGRAAHRLVFVNGRLNAALSDAGTLPPGAVLTGLAQALERNASLVEPYLAQVGDTEASPFQALNTALAEDGAVLHVARNTVVEAPVELIFIGVPGPEPVAVHPRLLVVVEPNAEATLVEHHLTLGAGPGFANLVTEIVVGEGARLHHYKIQREGAESLHLSTVAAVLAKDSTYDSFVLTQGTRWSRNEIRPVLDGTGVECRLSGAYMIRGTQHCDTTTVIDHARPHGTSREVYKGVIDGTARAVFQGKIIVRPDAQKTDGYQLNRALLLSDGAEIDSKPELEIYADDVKCSHGATAGELADEQLFYLRARGIDKETARSILIGAFLNDAIEEIRVPAVRDAFQAAVAGWLQSR